MDRMDLEKFVEVFVSDDEMSADIFVSPELGDYQLDIRNLAQFIVERGITVGIDDDLLQEILDKKNYGELITIAKGVEAYEGRDGYYEYSFDVRIGKKSGKPIILEDGSVDYKNMNLIDCVKKGDVVARYYPKVDGTDGYTVTGKPIKASLKKDMPPLRGKGFEKSEDGYVYTAILDGKPELNLGYLEIKNVCEISGDIGLETGNINFAGDLQISGNIKPGMEIKATGSITVNGSIEGSNVKAGKSLLVKGGIFGNDKTTIEASEDVMASFMENAVVLAGRDVITDCLINCDIKAGHDVVVTRKNLKFEKAGCIMGGSVKANRCVSAYTIGSAVGVKTDIYVGISYKVQEEYRGFKQALTEAETELTKIERAIELLEKKQGSTGNLMLQLVKTKIDKAGFIYKYKEICSKIEKNFMDGRDARIEAITTIYNGVNIHIDSLNAPTMDTYRSIVFKRKGPKIVSMKYEPESK